MTGLVKTSILISSLIAGLNLISCNNSQNNTEMEHEHHHTAGKDIYACPMHPEVIGAKGDHCPKCNMELELVENNKEDQFQVMLSTSPKQIEAEKTVNLSFSIINNGKNVPLDLSHEKKVHMLVVNEDLTWFNHIHPTENSDGKFHVSEVFPYGGKYLVYTDFKPKGASQTVIKQELQVNGQAMAKNNSNTPKLVSVVDGYTVSLVNDGDFKTNTAQDLKLSIVKNGKTISGSNIQQYLGAVAHIVIIGKADKDFLHIHPSSGEKYPIHGETSFEKEGIYRMWVQFQIDGKVHTADFTLKVTKGKEAIESEPHDHSGHKH